MTKANDCCLKEEAKFADAWRTWCPLLSMCRDISFKIKKKTLFKISSRIQVSKICWCMKGMVFFIANVSPYIARWKRYSKYHQGKTKQWYQITQIYERPQWLKIVLGNMYLTICNQNFQKHFLEQKCLYFDSNFTVVYCCPINNKSSLAQIIPANWCWRVFRIFVFTMC